MGKRSSFERRPRDFYPTPAPAVPPLVPHIDAGTRFAEPLAGDGALIDHLTCAGLTCVHASDIEPRRDDIQALDVFDYSAASDVDIIVTNPPWQRDTLHAVIEHLSDQRPTWLLFDADWMHTIQAAPYVPRLTKVVAIGRLKWIPDSKHTGKENCVWGLFRKASAKPTAFYGRRAKHD